jgi:hypothetical protein
MLEDLLNFPTLVSQSDKSEVEICAQISSRKPGFFPTLEQLMHGLSRKHNLVDSWIRYSEDKRGSPSWYILKTGKKYKVGFLGSDRSCNEGVYNDAYFACAVFIKLEMEERLIRPKQGFI